MDSRKICDGFEGQKLLTLPEKVLVDFIGNTPALGRMFITHIGYFPNAKYHYMQRKDGCPDNILIYCLRGAGTFKIGDKGFDMKPNQYIITPATEDPLTYYTSEEDPWTIYWVHFCGPDLEVFNRSFSITKDNLPLDIPFNKKGIDIWEEMYKTLDMGFSTENLCKANLCLPHFFSTFFYSRPNEGMEENCITKTILYMRSMLHEKLNVQDMAAIHNFSTAYFSTIFRKATGMPPLDYFIHLKIQKACQLLYDGNNKVKEVAQLLGYDDPYYFSRLFKKNMKVAPEHYKAMRSKDKY